MASFRIVEGDIIPAGTHCTESQICSIKGHGSHRECHGQVPVTLRPALCLPGDDCDSASPSLSLKPEASVYSSRARLMRRVEAFSAQVDAGSVSDAVLLLISAASSDQQLVRLSQVMQSGLLTQVCHFPVRLEIVEFRCVSAFNVEPHFFKNACWASALQGTTAVQITSCKLCNAIRMR